MSIHIRDKSYGAVKSNSFIDPVTTGVFILQLGQSPTFCSSGKTWNMGLPQPNLVSLARGASNLSTILTEKAEPVSLPA